MHTYAFNKNGPFYLVRTVHTEFYIFMLFYNNYNDYYLIGG